MSEQFLYHKLDALKDAGISSELPEPICTVLTSVMEKDGVVNATIVG